MHELMHLQHPVRISVRPPNTKNRPSHKCPGRRWYGWEQVDELDSVLSRTPLLVDSGPHVRELSAKNVTTRRGLDKAEETYAGNLIEKTSDCRILLR
jgi:hypothetical protein